MPSISSILRKIYGRTKRTSLPFGCPVCGHDAFERGRVLWGKLASQWELSVEERAYIDNQQGLCCLHCNSTLRSMTLADALLSNWRSHSTFDQFCRKESAFRDLEVLELNGAGQLSPYLALLPRHIAASYPEVDMQAMKYEEESFDVIVHSDTLEHIPDPLQSLRECYRVLKWGGVMVYTVPVIFGRLTRRRDDLSPSYHGSIIRRTEDYRVVTEYGFDYYLEPWRAGFNSISMHSLYFPDSTALICRKIRPIQPSA
jgi:SAM-dependent methyltransferase